MIIAFLSRPNEAQNRCFQKIICGMWVFLPTFRRFWFDNLRNLYILTHIPQIIHNDTWSLTKAEADNLRRKTSVFRRVTGTKKQIFVVLITTFDLVKNQHSVGLVDNVLDMNALF